MTLPVPSQLSQQYPLRHIRLNEQWASVLLGALEGLDRTYRWSGTEVEQDHAIAQIRAIMANLGKVYTHMFATGFYQGDGNATKEFDGLGFAPTAVVIVPRNQGYPLVIKTNVDGVDAWVMGGGMYADLIITLGSDGFTIGDGTNYLNLVNNPNAYYAWLAFAP